MKRIQFKKGLHFWLQGREYVVERCLTGDKFLCCCVLTSVKSKIEYSTLINFLFSGELEIEATYQENEGGKTFDYIKVDFTQIDSKLREEAKRRYSYVSYFFLLDVPLRTETSLQPIIEEIALKINDLSPPSWLTLYRWLSTYEAAGHDIRSLVPRHKGKGNYCAKLHPHVLKTIEQATKSIYFARSRPDIADVYEEVLRLLIHENEHRAAIGMASLKIPHRSTIYRFVSKLEPEVVATYRYGKRIANQMYSPVLKGPRPTRPLERVEIDHTKLPLFVVDTQTRMPIGTPWLTSAVDKYSGMTLGYYASFEPPSYLSVMQCLLHAIRPKSYLHSEYPNVENTWNTYGLPEVIVVDNGKEFYSTHFEDACLQLGITIQYCPPKMPWYKSTIERYFGALNSQLLSDKPGKKFPNFLQKCDYDPIKNAVISFEALQEILHIFIADVHNQSSHPELKFPRALVWSKAITEFPPALPASNQELKILIGSMTTRKVSRHGVEFEGLFYNSSDLARLRSSSLKSEKAIIKYDPTDLSRIYVKNPHTEQFLEVMAVSQDYTKGLSLWQHKVVKQFAREEGVDSVDIVGLVLAKEKIQQIVEREWKTTKKGKTRTAMARWLGVGNEEFKKSDQEFSRTREQNTNSTTDANEQIVDNISTKLNEMTGVSDLGSALNNDSSPLETSDTEESDKVNNNCDVNQTPFFATNKKIDSKQRKRSKRKSSTTKNINNVSTNELDIDEWKPDLSGWDVSIGLPKKS
ncbi:MAG: DDE-type integrase/transposase/recombinase [Rivularia sp. (in: cyanobacteria)]